MSIVKILPDHFENHAIEVTPKRSFNASGYDAVSGTYAHVTGNVRLYARSTTSIKDAHRSSPFLENDFVDGGDLMGLYADAKHAASSSLNNFAVTQKILNHVTTMQQSVRRAREMSIKRIEVPYTLNSDFMRKRVVREILFPYYRCVNPRAHWAFTNYNTLNFVTGSNVDGTEPLPRESVLMYPNKNAAGGVVTNTYLPQGAVTFDFRINPRYTTALPGQDFRAGTIFHVSGVYAVSLLTGSRVDKNGYVDGYRVALQVLSGTYTKPSMIDVSSATNSIFISDDNVLTRNNWHHVIIRWGTNTRNEGSGSFVIDGQHAGAFVIPSASLTTDIGDSPDVLYVGNFYEGPSTGSNTQSRFFSNTAARRNGVFELQSDPGDGPIDAPSSLLFDHPLNAELHELRIWKRYLDDETLVTGSMTSIIDMTDMMFYVPPFFTPESPAREIVDERGGVLQTPFFAINGTTDDPFNVALSFGVGGHYINLENFTRDFVNANYPIAWALTGSQIVVTSETKSTNDFLFSTGAIRRRNLTILPCDDGQFTPNYQLLSTGTVDFVPKSSSLNYHYTNDLGVYDASLVSLTNMIPSASYYNTLTQESGTLFSSIVGATPDNPGVDPGEVLTIFQRTRDNSSNEVSIFDISNLFYGNRINPTTFSVTDSAITGSGGRVSLTFKDDGHGNLYRADASTPHATWSSVGTILYDEGIAVITTPCVPYFGKEQHALDFEGLRNIYTLKVRVEASAGMFNSSSNPAYVPASASLDANDYDREFVYITGITLHDENMNVVMKSTLAQPVIKRTGDSITFNVGHDY